MSSWVELLEQTAKYPQGGFRVDGNVVNHCWAVIISAPFKGSELKELAVVPGWEPIDLKNIDRRAYSPDPIQEGTGKLFGAADETMRGVAEALDALDVYFAKLIEVPVHLSAVYAVLVRLILPHVDVRHPIAPPSARREGYAAGLSGVEYERK